MARFVDLNQLPVYHIAHHYILKNYTNHLYLVLHRPYLTVVGASPPTSPDDTDGRQQSCERCYSAALTILDCHEQLHQSPQLMPYRWYIYGLGSFHAFLAASTLLILSASEYTATADSSYRPQLLQALNRCLSRFQEMAPRSEVCAKAVPILQCLLYNDNGSHQHGVAAAQATVHIPSNWQSSSTDRHDVHTADNRVMQAPDFDSIQSQNSINIDNWLTVNPQLEALMSQLPSEQWLAPSSFPWDHWGSILSEMEVYEPVAPV